MTRVVLAGGGTAGHVMPAIAIADALVANGRPRTDVVFMGARGAMEERLVPERGYGIEVRRLRNFSRRIRPSLVMAVIDQLVAVVGCLRTISRRTTAIVVSIGGFASVPPVIAAWIRRVPIVAISYDATAGLATRLAARLAVANAVALPGSSLPRAEVTGAPVRSELLAIDPAVDRGAARDRLGVDRNRFLIAVVGGSLGSGTLNEVTDRLVVRWGARLDIAIRHVVGARNDDGGRRARDGSDGLQYQVIAFESSMADVLAAADVVVGRAGASTVAELSAVGVPAILVPWPAAAGDHQRHNAAWLAGAGGAIAIDEAEFSVDRLESELGALIEFPERLVALRTAARAAGRRDGAERIAQLVEREAR